MYDQNQDNGYTSTLENFKSQNKLTSNAFNILNNGKL